MALSKNFDHLFKILIVGDSCVDKSGMLEQFTDSSFSYPFVSTIGIDFKIKTIDLNGMKIKLQILDSTGQERFQNITTSYYRDAMGIMLVYDVTNPSSFDHVTQWLENIYKHASSDVLVMLIGNKCDEKNGRAVSKAWGEKVAADYSAIFNETSAKSNANIDKILNEMAEAILNNMQKQQQSKQNIIRFRHQEDSTIIEGRRNSC
uniref:Uncharacterized protein n=1 Tax=Panagrolaimus sp. ES5 TaxID=591445 RepID=A0AC34FEE4_9BILA